MTNLNKICMSALLLGAAAITTPAIAQAASNADSAQATTANTPAAQAAESPAASTQAAASTSSTQVAATDQAATHDMDTKAAANADVGSVGDTSKKYVRSQRAADFGKEQSITQQLNQQASAAASPSGSVR